MSRNSAGSSNPTHRLTGDRRDRNRGAGWQHVFAAIDDTTRLGFARIYPDESADSALDFRARSRSDAATRRKAGVRR